MEVDENTQLKKDFKTSDQELTRQDEELDSAVEINEAMEMAGTGCGTILYSLGPFLLFCLEGGEVVVLSVVGMMLRCEWDLTNVGITFLQVTPCCIDDLTIIKLLRIRGKSTRSPTA